MHYLDNINPFNPQNKSIREVLFFISIDNETEDQEVKFLDWPRCTVGWFPGLGHGSIFIDCLAIVYLHYICVFKITQ